jgi:uncharacterized protein
VGFGRYLRWLGFPVGTGQILTFCRAAGLLDPFDREDLYWAAHSTFGPPRKDLEEFDGAFHAYFGSGALEDAAGYVGGRSRLSARETPPDGRVLAPTTAGTWTLPGIGEEDVEGETAVRIVASDAEVLRRKSFDALTEEELGRTAKLIRQFPLEMPRRRTRRLQPAAGGRRFDLRRTLRRSLRTQGEPFNRAWRDRRVRPRPVVLILDVSGSMAPYSRALVQFGFATMAGGRRVEVFCFGTRLTRITRILWTRDPDGALRMVGALVPDWDGGTRIGASLKDLLDRWGQRSSIRGAVVVLCSDGLERGDPETLRAQMARLSRLAHKVIWVNPLKGSPQYEPLARGMAAAMPFVDVFLPGHNVESLEALSEILAR